MLKKLILYGAGNRCKILCKCLKYTDIEIVAILDADSRKWGKSLEKYQIHPPQDIRNYQDAYLCITIAEVGVVQEIRETLCQVYHFKLEREIFYHDLIFESYKNNLKIKQEISKYTKNWNEKRSVLFDCYNGLVLGGIETWTVELCEALIEGGNDDTFIVSGKGDYNVSPIIENHIIYVDNDYRGCFLEDEVLNVINVIMSKMPCKVITCKPDEVMLAAYLIKCYYWDLIEVISVIHNSNEKIYKEYMAFKECPDINIGVSRDICTDMIKMGFQSDNFFNMLCPFSCEQAIVRNYTDNNLEPIRIGYAGRMDGMEYSQKRMDLWLKLIEVLVDKQVNFRLEFAGDGLARQKIEEYVLKKHLKEKIRFLGRLERFQMPDFWKRQDICVNLADYEGRSISILEAMGNGAVPVVTATSGVREDITDGVNGYIIPLRDYYAAAERIEYLAMHREYLRVMGNLAHDAVYPKSLMGPHLRFWEEILEIKEKKEETLALVSIIVPVYNIAPYIKECVESIQKQTYPKLEIIIINDGSTDGSGEICEQLANSDSRIRLIHQVNSGLVAARNTGIEASSGEYISFVDGDDWIEPDMIEELVKRIGKSDLITSGVYRQITPSRTIERYDKFPEGSYFGERQLSIILKKMIYDMDAEELQPFTPWRWNKLYTSKLVKRMYREASLNISYAEDAVFLYKYILRCHSIVICHKCFYHYRYRENSLVHEANAHMLIDINSVYLSLEKDFRNHKLGEQLLYQLQKWVSFVTCKALNEHMGFDDRIHIPEFIVDLSGLENKRLIVYGAGSAGRDTYLQLKGFGYTVVLWVDKDYEFYQSKGFLVVSPDEIVRQAYDLVLIAVKDEILAEKIKKELVKKGISEAKLVWRRLLRIY